VWRVLAIPEAGGQRRQLCCEMGKDIGGEQAQLRQTKACGRGKDELAL
jgi:hypothetical protein